MLDREENREDGEQVGKDDLLDEKEKHWAETRC